MAALRYRTIVADPPWEYPEGFSTQSRTRGKWAAEPIHNAPLPYPSMSVEAVKALPIRDLCDSDARLFLWTTNKYLRDAFGVMDAWGFRYRQVLIWHKLDGNMGGSVAPNSAEFLLVGVKGSPKVLQKMKSSVVAHSQGKRHSTKPEVFLDLIEQASPGPYLELFARRNRFGWDTWGNEAMKHVEIEGCA